MRESVDSGNSGSSRGLACAGRRSGSPNATHAVDIATTLDRGVASLRAHRVYLESLQGALADPDYFLRDMARQTGEQFGGGLATSFELVSFT